MVCSCSSIFGGTSSSTRSRTMSCNGVSMAWCLVLLMVGQGLASPTTSTAKPVDHQKAASANSAEIASEIVQQLQTLGSHRGILHAAAAHSKLPTLIGGTYVDAYNELIPVIPVDESSQMGSSSDGQGSKLTPSGLNISGVLGMVEYLILLILLSGSIEGVAKRFNASRHRRDLRFTPEVYPGPDWPEHSSNPSLDLIMMPSSTAKPFLHDIDKPSWGQEGWHSLNDGDADDLTWQDQEKEDDKRPTWQDEEDRVVYNGHRSGRPKVHNKARITRISKANRK